MFQRAFPELRDCHGGDGRAAGIHAVQAAQEIHSGGHCHGLGMLSYISPMYLYLLYDGHDA